MSLPHYEDDLVTLHHGDCLAVLRELAEASVDAVVTDPPYALEFMGRAWDGWDTPQAFQEWCTEWATECLRILKPGGYFLAFGGSRTWHRLAAAAEDAGFEIRDSIAWLYGSGFPKSMDVSKAIDAAAGHSRQSDYVPNNGNAVFGSGMGGGRTTESDPPVTADAARWAGWGTALKPAFEPIVVGRKPLAGTVAANVQEHGTGALNIDACRVGDAERTNPAGSASSLQRESRVRHGYRENVTESVGEESTVSGRWPTNVLLDNHQAADLDQQSGVLTSGTMRAGTTRAARGGAVYGRLDADATERDTYGDTYGDTGGASRFFPVFRYQAKAATSERPNVDGVQHPTVKPLDLMRWLVRLVTPPGAIILEPFAGSGTTAEACVLEDRQCIAIEREADYLPLIVSRLRKPQQQGLFDLGDAS